MGNIPPEQLERVKTSYGTVELTDAANLEALETIGRVRANAPARENTLQALEDDSLSSDPDMNTEIAVLNKINAASLIGLRNTQDTNKLLVTPRGSADRCSQTPARCRGAGDQSNISAS